MERVNVNSPSSTLTGCVSPISVLKPHRHAYYDALKDYAVHYAEAQSYLVASDWQTVHDYNLIDNSPSEPDHGLLGDDGEPVKPAQISDDDIVRCGYLGWLRH